MCSCVSRPHQLILALCNVNCVRTNDSFWVLYLFIIYLFIYLFLLYLFEGLIIYLIGSRVVLLEAGFPPCVAKYDMFQWVNVC